MAETDPADNTPPERPPPLPAEVPVLRPSEELPVLRPVDDGLIPAPEDDMHYEVPKSPSYVYFWAYLLVGGLIYLALLIRGDEPRRFALAGLESLPFLLLALLAYAGEGREEMRLLTLVYWLFLVGLVAAVTLLLTFISVIDPTVLLAKQAGRPPGPVELFQPGGLLRLGLALFGTIVAVGLGAFGFAPMVRRLFARGLPFDPESFVHAVALATVVAMTGVLLVPLAVIGEPPLLVMIRNFKDVGGNDALKEMADPSALRDQIYATVWLLPAGIMAVGYPLHRSLRKALVRVGLVLPTFGQVAFGLVAAVVMVFVMTFFDFAISWLWRQLGWPTTDAKQFEELMKFAINPQGAVVIGVTAGLGEELFARGVLQPRLGIVLSNLLFTALHGLQYNWDGLLSVFVIGLILGVIRKRTNTSTSAIVHGTYDFLLIMMTVYEIDPTKWVGG